MANGTIAFDTLSTSGQISGTAKSLDTDYDVNGSLKAWGNLNGSSFGLRDSFNFASATDNGTGTYTVTYTSAMGNTNYSTSGSGSDGRNFYVHHSNTYSTAAFKMNINERSDNSAIDADYIGFEVAGDLA